MRSDRSPGRCAPRWAAPAFALAALACGAPEPLLEPRVRLVDLRAGASPPPVATLDDERRTVLEAPAETLLVSGMPVTVGVDARVALRRSLEGNLAKSAHVVLAPTFRARGVWTRLPAQREPVQRRGSARFVAAEIALPGSLVGRSGVLDVVALAPQPARTRIDTPPLEIPAGARLDFGVGSLAAAREQGPVAFRVSACEAERCTPLHEERLDPESGWQDRQLALDALAGTQRTLRFETELGAAREDAFSLAVWSSPTLYAPRPRLPSDFDVLLISLDTLRADRLPVYGYPLDTAPFLSRRFGERGVVFEAAVSPATSTRPSHATLFTSLQPAVHGQHGGSRGIPAAAPTLAERLREAGFTTGAVTENATLDVRHGIGRGFDSYREDKRRDVAVAEGHIEDTFAAGLRFLDRQRGKRLFLFLHTYQVHFPYEPPEAYAGLFREPAAGFEPSSRLAPERDPALYDREIRYVDDQLRALFAALEARGLEERTLVVVTSDHGEEFLEHGAVGHGPNLHAEVLNVPLLFTGPGLRGGRRVADPVGLADVMPTLLELAGAPLPATLQGRSLVPHLRGEAAAGLRPRAVFSESRVGVADRGDPKLAVRLGERKLIRVPEGDGHRYQLFDLSRDAREREDRYPGAAAEAADLVALLDAYLSGNAALRTQLEREARGAPAELAPDPERDAKLRALGYLE